MSWGDFGFAAVGAWLSADQGLAFARARRSGVTYVGRSERTPVKKTDDPSLFARNIWSKAVASGVFAAMAIFLGVLAFLSN